MFENFKGRIIWSADNVSHNELLDIVSNPEFPRHEVAVKLDRLYLTKYGLRSIRDIQKQAVPVFADAKIAEIPSKVQELAKLHLEHKPWMLNCMAGVCDTGFEVGMNPDELKFFAGECAMAGTKSCVVTVLTSKTPTLAELEFGKSAMNAVMFYAELARHAGITDIVCSPQEAEEVSKLGCFDINTPGIRLPTSDANDQQRIMTPARALAAGATRLVIGRDLSRDGKFAENLAKILANIEGGIA